MYKRILLIIVSIVAFPLLVRAEEISLTLDEAITIALRDNKTVALKTADVKKAKYGISEAQAALFPGLNAAAGWSDTRGLYDKDVGVYTAGIGVKQLLYAGGKVVNAVKVSEYAYESVKAALDQAKQDTVFLVTKAYYALMLSQKAAALNKTMLENTQGHFKVVIARYAQGQASESDRLRMKSALSTMQQEYEASVRQTDAVSETLRNLLNLDPDVTIKPNYQFKYKEQDLAYDKAFVKALQARPEIRQVEAQRKIAGHSLEVAKAGNRPTVTAAWDYYARSAALSGTAKNRNDYNIIGITVSWPVFDGWQTKAKVEKALVDVQEAQLQREKLDKDIALDLKTAYVELSNAIDKMKSIEDQVLVYKDAVEVMQKKFNEGIASSLDVQDAMLAYDISLFNQTQALYDYLTAKAAFDKATGGVL
jgi:outer membrane protein TolC